ncbi:MAG: DMT family transporter [Alphaproteobacteria bacterium]
MAALSCMFGGSGFVAMRILVTETEPITVAWLRNGIGTAILVVAMLALSRVRVAWRDLLGMSLVGVFFFAVFQWLMAWALQFTTSGRASIAVTFMPFMALAVGSVLGIERPTARKLAGLALATGGVVLALWQQAGEGSWRGDVAVLLCGAIGGATAVWISRYVQRYPPLVVVAVSGIPASLFLLAGGVLTGASVPVPELSAKGWLAALWLGAACAAACYFLWYWALRHAEPTLVSVSIALNPVTTFALAAVLLGEAVTPAMIIGTAAIITGIIVVNWRRRAVAAPAPAR